jgi:hypothetical protein
MADPCTCRRPAGRQAQQVPQAQVQQVQVQQVQVQAL